MEVFSIKKTRIYESTVFVEFKVMSDLAFCCKQFKKYASSFDVWDNKTGKFCIINKDVLIPITFCPFCGEEIKYTVYY